MAYIPTIHTYEDDINENRGFDQAPISGGVQSVNQGNQSILIADKPKSSLTKKILEFLAILFIAGSLAILGYYFYNKWQTNQKEKQINAEASSKQEEINQQQTVGVESDLSKILPNLAPGIQKYTASAVKKNNIIILTLNDNNLNGIDNYSSIYGYILAHMTDLNKDLYYTFDISNLIQNLAKDDGLDDTYNSTDYISNSSSTNNSNSLIKKPIPVKVEDLSWETKTLNNQTFQISNAGVTTFVYGYAGHNYLILATSLKDFFDIQGSLNTQ